MACNCLGVVWDDGRALAAALIHYYYLLSFSHFTADIRTLQAVATAWPAVAKSWYRPCRAYQELFTATIFSPDSFSMAQSGSQGVPLRPLVALEVACQRVLGTPDFADLILWKMNVMSRFQAP